MSYKIDSSQLHVVKLLNTFAKQFVTSEFTMQNFHKIK